MIRKSDLFSVHFRTNTHSIRAFHHVPLPDLIFVLSLLPTSHFMTAPIIQFLYDLLRFLLFTIIFCHSTEDPVSQAPLLRFCYLPTLHPKSVLLCF